MSDILNIIGVLLSVIVGLITYIGVDLIKGLKEFKKDVNAQHILFIQQFGQHNTEIKILENEISNIKKLHEKKLTPDRQNA